MTSEDSALCHHEAGHAVVTHLFGCHVVAITVNFETGEGHTHARPPERLGQRVDVRLAGGRAEKHLDPVLAAVSRRALQDEVEAMNLIGEHLRTLHIEADAESVNQELAAECEALVDANWSDIQAVAAALLRRRRGNSAEMTGVEFRQIISGQAK